MSETRVYPESGATAPLEAARGLPSARRLGAALAAIAVGLLPARELRAQPFAGRGSTAQGDALRGKGRFLRGMAWYELGTAQAGALENEAVIAWNRAVRADYEQYLHDKVRRANAKKALTNEREAEAYRRLDETRKRWRERPTVDDIRSGLALNALACDLADPKIPAARWRAVPVELPPEITIDALAFRFADVPKYKLPPGMAQGSVALARMKGERWPVSLRRSELERERTAYQRAVATVVATCAAGKPLNAPQVDAVRDALLELKRKAAAVVPADGGIRKQANEYLDRLDQATKVFLDRDFAEELVRDAERHKAKTVGELLGFMKKYRLLFAEGDDDPAAWATYKTLYELLKRQKVSLDVADEPAPAEGEAAPGQPGSEE